MVQQGMEWFFNVQDKNFRDALDYADRRLGTLPAATAAWTKAVDLASNAVTGLASHVGDWVNAAMEAELSEARLSQVLQSTQFAAGKTTSEMVDLANSIEKATRFDADKELLPAMAKLATFTKVTVDQFDRATRLATDLAETGFGSVESAAVMLGKALQDPVKGVTALTRVGVTLTDEQKAQIAAFMETNDVLKAQGVILDAVAQQVGGVAEAMGETTAGKIARLKNAFGNLEEALGSVVANGLTPFLDALNNDLPNATDGAISELDKISSAVNKVSQTWVNTIESLRAKMPEMTSTFEAILTPKLFQVLDWLDNAPSSKAGYSAMNAASSAAFKKITEDVQKREADRKRASNPSPSAGGEGAEEGGDNSSDMAQAASWAHDWIVQSERAAEAVRKSIRTPFQEAEIEAQKLNDLTQRGFLTPDERSRAMADIRESLLKGDRDKLERAMERERRARGNVGDMDERIADLNRDTGFHSSSVGLRDMWTKVQTAALSRPAADRTVEQLRLQREEVSRRWEEEKRLLEQIREAVKSHEANVNAVFNP
jgi:hypothetical protein